jgi:cobalt/nickel transport system permease protein
MYSAAVPFWYTAVRKTKEILSSRMVPVLSIFSAFVFVIMMFNVPLPGGTTGHAVGGTLLAIVLGPWAAVLGISMVLLIQAVLFGDGGILAFGANVFNMAIALPLVGYAAYRLVSGSSPVGSRRRVVGAVVGGYLGLNVGAFLTAVELGLQPLFFQAADGTPLYSPFGLAQSIPAMVIPHLLVAGVVEGVVTGLVVAYLQRSHQALIRPVGIAGPRPGMAGLRWLWVGLGVLVLLSPLGLIASGSAWGEWGAEELRSMGLGFVPQGLERLQGLWRAPLPDYAVGDLAPVLGYVASAVAGVVLISLFSWLYARRLAR